MHHDDVPLGASCHSMWREPKGQSNATQACWPAKITSPNISLSGESKVPRRSPSDSTRETHEWRELRCWPAVLQARVRFTKARPLNNKCQRISRFAPNSEAWCVAGGQTLITLRRVGDGPNGLKRINQTRHNTSCDDAKNTMPYRISRPTTLLLI